MLKKSAFQPLTNTVSESIGGPVLLEREEAYSWLGVPILAGDESIGMIAVQSYPSATTIPQAFDLSHQQILTTIAAQASVAIQNARLYTQTDKALAQRVQQLNSILSTASEGIILLDNNLTIIEVNRALTNMLNTTPANLLNNKLVDIQNHTLKDLEIEKEILAPLLAGEIDNHQSKLKRFGEFEIPVERTITPVREDEHTITGWLIVYRDLTEEYELEHFRTDMTRMLVHDLRSPIVAIQSGLDMVEVLLEDGDKDTLLEMLNISRNGSTIILGMINQILHLNRLESGQIQLHPEPLAIPTIFNEERKHFHSIIDHANLKITGEFSNDLPVIEADRDLLTRVMHNLLDNAIKFSKDDSEIMGWGNPDPQHPGYVLFGVKDQGTGIPKEIQPSLFDKYFTSQHEESRRKGTGLGLYFCKLAIEAHGGQIWVDSELYKGSNFIIRIPIENKQDHS
jgi:PAS domain S-box-containing protein